MLYAVVEFRAKFTPAAEFHAGDRQAMQQVGWSDAVATVAEADFCNLTIADFFYALSMRGNNVSHVYLCSGDGMGSHGGNFGLDATAWHTYKFEWRPNIGGANIRISVDGNVVSGNIPAAPAGTSGTSSNPMHPLKFKLGSLEDFGDSGGSLEIDWIRIWKLPQSVVN